ncbi:MAG: rhomboid family intramembrane serine protease [Nitrospirae bacterium]|nr:rhomboid family intramembrane serine protease [Nitrospirota bacterium]
MIPLKDDNPTNTYPYVTISIIIINILVFFFEISLGSSISLFLNRYGAKPLFVLNMTSPIGYPSPLITIFSSMFLHGGLLHVGGNMLYLWIFGNNIEDSMGHLRFVIFYLLSGIIAVYAFSVVNPQSLIPMVGASGAVSGVLGAYLILFPRAKVLTLVPLGFYMQMIKVPAIFVLGMWIVVQIINGSVSRGGGGGVAWFAHIGGFVAGMALISLFKKSEVRG